MPTRSKWGVSPRESIDAAVERLGKPAVVSGCIALLRGKAADPSLILSLRGVAGLDEEPGPAYWLRVWAARGLMWQWDDRAEAAIMAALSDEEWRVREMAKVVARHRVATALRAVEPLQQDPNARVRKAAQRAVLRLSAS